MGRKKKQGIEFASFSLLCNVSQMQEASDCSGESAKEMHLDVAQIGEVQLWGEIGQDVLVFLGAEDILGVGQ